MKRQREAAKQPRALKQQQARGRRKTVHTYHTFPATPAAINTPQQHDDQQQQEQLQERQQKRPRADLEPASQGREYSVATPKIG